MLWIKCSVSVAVQSIFATDLLSIRLLQLRPILFAHLVSCQFLQPHGLQIR